MTPSPARSAAPPGAGNVTVIGDNSQIVTLVTFCVGAEFTVQVFTSDATLEETLVIYPNVQVTVVPGGYHERPTGLPPAPYIVAVEDPAIAERIRGWLPPTSALFLASVALRRRRVPGFLHFQTAPEDARRAFIGRLSVLRRVDHLMRLGRKAKRPLILIYADPDPDAVGSALGLATLWRHVGATPTIRFTGDVRRYQNRLLLQWLRAGITELGAEERAEADLIAVVDCQPGFWRDDPPHARVVIDHHPHRADTRAEYTDIRPYGATSSIITEYLVEAGIVIDRKLATALLYGVSTDTDDLRRNVTHTDIRAYEQLLPRCDQNFLVRLNKSQVPMAMLDWIAWGIAHRVVLRDAVVVHFGAVPTPDVLVQCADLLLLTCGVNWVVCIGIHDERLLVIFRGDGHHNDVGKRAQQAFADIGSAGGHRTMARAEIPLPGSDEGASVELLVDRLFRRMPERRRISLKRRLTNHLRGAGPADPARSILG